MLQSKQKRVKVVIAQAIQEKEDFKQSITK